MGPAKSVVMVLTQDVQPQALDAWAASCVQAMAAGNRMGMGITPEHAWIWLSLNPAKGLAIDKRTGSLEPGKAADVVLWNGNQFSVYSRPEKVWIDGAVMYNWADAKRRPTADFELGQQGAGDPK